jgi:hypothetical protein
MFQVLFNYPESEYNEFEVPRASPENGVVDGFLDTKSIQNVPQNFMPVKLDQDPSDPELFKSDVFGVKLTIDELLKLEGLRPSGIELSCSEKVYIFLSVEHIKKHNPGFEMKGPGWRWSADDGSWEEVSKPNPDFVWSSLQTWEPSCKSHLCKQAGCNGLSLHFDSEKYPGLLSGYENSLYLFRGYGGNFCEQGKEKHLCENCGILYDPNNPGEVGYHHRTKCNGWYSYDS